MSGFTGPLFDFVRSHPDFTRALEALEHAGLDAAEELAMRAIGGKLGILEKLFPVQSLMDAGKQAVENFVDGKLAPAPAPQFAPAPAAPDAPTQSDPVTRAKQAAASARQMALADAIDAGDRAAPGQRFVQIDPSAP